MKKAISNILLITLLTAGVYAEQASTPPAFVTPQNLNTYPTTAAFDLDRATGTRADWTGWKDSDPTSGYGHAYDNHRGTDYGMVNGTPLYSIGNGSVTASRDNVPTDDHSDTGNYMMFTYTEQGETYKVNFWHLNVNGALKDTGETVTKGELVAYSDNTGNSTGPHLHYGIAKTSGSGNYSCPFYHAWWEDDEYYYSSSRPCLTYVAFEGSILNCRQGTSTSYDVITSISGGTSFISPHRNSWWKIYLPMPAADLLQSKTSSADISNYCSETGTWQTDSAQSAITENRDDINRVEYTEFGSRYTSFTTASPAGTSSYTWTCPQTGTYKIQTGYPENANAKNVSYIINHKDGQSTVTLDQNGTFGEIGNGTVTSPYIIGENSYQHTDSTVGAASDWDEYSPEGSGLSEKGPEQIYAFTLTEPSDIRITVEHSDYPTKDIDIHLLNALSNTACIARADWTIEENDLAAGTYYISCDSFGEDSSTATDYTLIIEFSETTSMPDSHINLGEFDFGKGQDYVIQIDSQSVTQRMDTAKEGRVYSDFFKIIPIISYRSGYASDSYLTRIDTSTTPQCSIVIKTDQNTGNDTDDISDCEEIAIYSNYSLEEYNENPIVGKAVTGQRFVCREYTDNGWYKIDLTNSCKSLSGWINGKHLIIYHPEAAIETTVDVEDWELFTK